MADQEQNPLIAMAADLREIKVRVEVLPKLATEVETLKAEHLKATTTINTLKWVGTALAGVVTYITHHLITK